MSLAAELIDQPTYLIFTPLYHLDKFLVHVDKMRVTISNLLSSLLLAASASANEANVYLFHGGDSQHIDSQSLSTSASTARLVFAQRLDLAQYHSLKDADEDAIQVLNEFGGRPRKLFGGDATHSRPKAMFVVEGVENVQGW